MKSAMKHEPTPNYVHSDVIPYNGAIVPYTVIYFDNGITEYIFDNTLPDDDKQSIIDLVTLFPFIY